jgi:hypothetical protein
MDPAAPYKTTLATAGAGRYAAVAQLQSLADRLRHLPLADVAEVLVLPEPVLDDLRHQATLALGRRPAANLVKRIEEPTQRPSRAKHDKEMRNEAGTSGFGFLRAVPEQQRRDGQHDWAV